MNGSFLQKLYVSVSVFGKNVHFLCKKSTQRRKNKETIDKKEANSTNHRKFCTKNISKDTVRKEAVSVFLCKEK